MEIHELNTFSGTLGASDYFATDNGTDTSKVSASAITDPLNARIDNIITSPAPSAQEITDARLGANGTTYSSLGVAIRSQIKDVNSEIVSFSTNAIMDDVISSEVVHGEFWSTSDGSIGTSSSWCRSKSLIPVDGPHIYISEIGQNVQLLCFTKAGSLIGTWTVRPNGGTVYQITDPNVGFIALNTAESSSITAIKLRVAKNFDVLEYPYSADGLIFCADHVCSGSGVVSASSSWDCALIAELKGGEKYYCNALYTSNFICFDENYNVMAATPYVEIPTGGRIYTIPSGAKYCWVNIQKSKTHGDISVVYYKITQPEKVLAIGDSLTWLDGQNGFDNATLFLGWQKQLQKAGYWVESAGFSGYSYATGTEYGSIYEEVVANGMDVSGYDVIILFGGTNDNLYSVPLGNRVSVYGTTTFDASTFNGALSGIINYIRAHNPTCKIVLSNLIKSEAAVRNFVAAKAYIDEIAYNAEFWSCYYVDMFSKMNVSPNTNSFAQFFYDNTHANKAGMVRIGKQMLEAVEQA